MTNKVRKIYEVCFKLEVARMVVEQDLKIIEVSREMGVSVSAIGRWVKQYRAEQNGQAGIGKPLTAEQQRIHQLEKEVRQLRLDNDLLKKASAFFARELK